MFASERTQMLVLVGLSVGIVVLAAATYLADRLVFQRFLGRFNPVVASIAVALLGGVLLSKLLSRDWFAIYRPGDLSRFLWPSVLAVILALIMILVDRRTVLSEELNVHFPHSLLYYPVMGYAAEILFHVLPLFVIINVSMAISSKAGFEAIIWPIIFFAALLEPIFQILPLIGKHSTFAVAFITVHLFVFNVVQLALFKRYDFVTMYSFRMAYYLVWHIVWGHFRLGILF